MRNEKGQFIKGHSLGLRFGAGQKNHSMPHREDSKIKMRLSHLGKKYPNYPKNRKKAKYSPEVDRIWRNKLSVILSGKPQPWNSGNKHWNWKGGISPISETIRKSIEYKTWRQLIFERDNFTCVICGQIRGNIEADHIKPFSLYPKLRFLIDNGRTLCHNCHLKTDNYAGKIKRFL